MIFPESGRAVHLRFAKRRHALRLGCGLASLGAALADQIGGISHADAEDKIQESIRTRLY